ncbi:MAG TPA: hypothetical protein VFJ09_07110 [Nocardioidaceae bacterium]|nr:hypothetical protein [Nocardioidaceae bacterium]
MSTLARGVGPAWAARYRGETGPAPVDVDVIASGGADPNQALTATWDYLSSMATIVLRVRLVGGDHTDLTYEDPDCADEVELIDQVIEVLKDDSGVLRCRHGERLIAVYARGVASIEVSPRGAIL